MKQFALKALTLDVGAILRSNGGNMPFVNTKGKVTRINEANLVGSPPESKMKRVMYLTDATGSMSIAFCRQRAVSLALNVGDVVKVENLRLSTWNGQVSGNVSDETTFTITDEEIDTTKAVFPKKSNIVSSVTPVKGFKDFSITCKCINRNTVQAMNACTKLISCQSCNTTFLKDAGKKDVRCMVLLNKPRQQWYTAFTQVNIIYYRNEFVCFH